MPGAVQRLTWDRRNIHNRWNRDLPPALTIDSADTVVFETRNASDDQVVRESTTADFPRIDRGRTHALTGPVFVRGAEPGDALEVRILNVQVEDWGFQMVAPGQGFLPEGVAPAEPGEIRTLAPGHFAGNIGVREPGALFSTPPWATARCADGRRVWYRGPRPHAGGGGQARAARHDRSSGRRAADPAHPGLLPLQRRGGPADQPGGERGRHGRSRCGAQRHPVGGATGGEIMTRPTSRWSRRVRRR